MIRTARLHLAALFAVVIGAFAPTPLLAANAGITLFSPTIGDVYFPGLSTTNIDNVPIGANTASTGAFTTLSASGAVSGTGFTNRFATPGPIGNTTPSTGAFTTLSSSGAYTPTGGVAAAGGLSVSPRLVMTGNWKPLAITDGTEVTCVATTTYIAEIFIPANMTVTGVSLVNATAVAGNIQVGLADSTGAPIAAALSVSTAASGTAAYQRVPFAAPYAAKGPATYYVQLQCNNTGYKFRAHTVGDFGTQSQTSGTYGTFASFTPAGTFTTAVGPVANLY